MVNNSNNTCTIQYSKQAEKNLLLHTLAAARGKYISQLINFSVGYGQRSYAPLNVLPKYRHVPFPAESPTPLNLYIYEIIIYCFICIELKWSSGYSH